MLEPESQSLKEAAAGAFSRPRTFEVHYAGHFHLLGHNDATDLLLVRDVTQQQQHNDDVRHTISQYESICDFIQDVYYRIDMQGRFLFLSPSCEKLLHYRAEELLHTSFADLTISSNAIQELMDILQKAPEVHDYHVMLRCKKGLHVSVSLTAKRVVGEDGTEGAIEGIFRDVSERDRLDTLLDERELAYKSALSYLEHVKRAMDHHVMVSTTGPDGRIISVNDNFLKVSRYNLEEVVGKTHDFLNSGYHPKSFFKEMWRVLNRGSIWRGEIRNRKKNGDIFWVDATIVPFLTPVGQPYQYVGMATDVSVQVRLRMRMARGRDFLHRVIHAMGEGVIVMDLQGRLIALNKEGERLLGWQEAELMHKNIHDAIHATRPDGSELPQEQCAVHQSLLGRAFRVEDDFYQCKDGRFLPVSHVTSPLKDGEEIIGSVAIFRDNGLARKRQFELEQARDAALQSAELKSAFLADMSHEIRTPMNAILGMNDLLMDTQLDEKQVEFSEIIRDSAQSLLSLINDILDFSKIEAGKVDIEAVDFLPVAVVEGCAELLAAQAHKKGISLMTFVAPSLPTILKGDPGRLRQMLINLINNALKFTEEGEVLIRVEPAYDGGGQAHSTHAVMVHFSVTDTGIGVPDALRQGLFEPFTQADSATSRRYGGTGLGLAISKKLAELMGGTIGVETANHPQFGEGSSFWFRVPFSPVSATPKHDALIPDYPQHIELLYGVRLLSVLKNASDHAFLGRYVEAWQMVHQGRWEVAVRGHVLQEAMDAREAFQLIVVALSSEDVQEELWRRYCPATWHDQTTRWVALLDREDKRLRQFARDLGFSACLVKPVRQEAWVLCFSQLLTADPAADWMVQDGPGAPVEGGALARMESDAALLVDEKSGDGTTLGAYDALEAGKLLLLVEDNPVNQKVTLLQLKKLGYAAHTVSNGREAVEAVANLPYALILMDCQMPVMDGFEATHAIRKLYETGGQRTSWHHIPIIAMTANAMKGDRERCLHAGMDDYLSKPVAPETLLKKLQYWIPLGSADLPPIELQQLRQLFGDDESMIRELLLHFPLSARELLDRLQQAVQEEEGGRLNDAAFELQEACANMGAVGMAAVARTLERAALDGDWNQTRYVMERLEKAFRDVERYVQNY